MANLELNIGTPVLHKCNELDFIIRSELNNSGSPVDGETITELRGYFKNLQKTFTKKPEIQILANIDALASLIDCHYERAFQGLFSSDTPKYSCSFVDPLRSLTYLLLDEINLLSYVLTIRMEQGGQEK